MTLEEATNQATQLNIMFMETSAKAGHNVKSLFKKIAMSLPGMEKEAQDANTSSYLLLPWPISLSDISLQRSTSRLLPQEKYQKHHNATASLLSTLLPHNVTAVNYIMSSISLASTLLFEHSISRSIDHS